MTNEEEEEEEEEEDIFIQLFLNCHLCCSLLLPSVVVPDIIFCPLFRKIYIRA